MKKKTTNLHNSSRETFFVDLVFEGWFNPYPNTKKEIEMIKRKIKNEKKKIIKEIMEIKSENFRIYRLYLNDVIVPLSRRK